MTFETQLEAELTRSAALLGGQIHMRATAVQRVMAGLAETVAVLSSSQHLAELDRATEILNARTTLALRMLLDMQARAGMLAGLSLAREQLELLARQRPVPSVSGVPPCYPFEHDEPDTEVSLERPSR
jgi:hypothetical protein